MGLRSYRLTRCGHIWASGGGDARNSRWVWTAVLEYALGNRWKDFEAGDRSETEFLRLLDRLSDTERYESDAYGVSVDCQ